MSEVKNDQEPSMEEILASIRRIIADDTPPAQVAAGDDEILELTEIAPPEDTAAALIAGLAAADSLPAPEPAAVVPAPAEYQMPILTHDDGQQRVEAGLVSEETAITSAAAFASMASEARRRLARDQPIGDGLATVEGIVKELMRPMLKDWLDAHLPELVERLVAEEIERLSRASK